MKDSYLRKILFGRLSWFNEKDSYNIEFARTGKPNIEVEYNKGFITSIIERIEELEQKVSKLELTKVKK